MAGFKKSPSSLAGWSHWQSNPDADTAHESLLGWLKDTVTSGFLQPTEALTNPTKGNLGEFIAYRIGKEFVFTDVDTVHTANAWDPLSKISRSEIDIVWLHFGSVESDDWAVLQEVKTTGGASLELADHLIADYDKLFGEDLHLTLQTRLGGLKNKLEQQGQGVLSPRMTALGGPSPDRARGIRLVPTLIHDATADSLTKMSMIRQVLLGRGWASDVVECWSIDLADLDDRLTRLARGEL